jgi:hypothetical protein
MSVIQTVLMFAGIPLAVVALVAFAVYGRSALHQPNRYRPGKPWTYGPAWFIPHPDAIDDVVSERIGIGAGTHSSVTAAGGASGEW